MNDAMLIKTAVVIVLMAIATSAYTSKEFSRFQCSSSLGQFKTFGGCRHFYSGDGYNTIIDTSYFTFDYFGAYCKGNGGTNVYGNVDTLFMSSLLCMTSFKIEFRLSEDCPDVTTHTVKYIQNQGLFVNQKAIESAGSLTLPNSTFTLQVDGQPSTTNANIELRIAQSIVRFNMKNERFFIDATIPTYRDNFMLDANGLCGPVHPWNNSFLENRKGEIKSCTECKMNTSDEDEMMAVKNRCNTFFHDWHSSNETSRIQTTSALKRRLNSRTIDAIDINDARALALFARVRLIAERMQENSRDLMCNSNEEFLEVYHLCSEELIPAKGLSAMQLSKREDEHFSCALYFCVVRDIEEALIDVQQF